MTGLRVAAVAVTVVLVLLLIVAGWYLALAIGDAGADLLDQVIRAD